MKTIKKSPIWVEKDLIREVQECLSKSGFKWWSETQVFQIHFLTVVVTSAVWIVVMLITAALNN